MADDFYPFVDSGDPAPDNAHITGTTGESRTDAESGTPRGAGDTAEGRATYATRISIYDDMFSTPRVVVIEPSAVRSYLEEVTNTVYRCMKEQGGTISLMVIRELVENFIHANFMEPIISILDGGNTIRFADQGPGIEDKERAFEFGVTSANRDMKRYIRGTGAGFPMVQQYLEASGGAISIEDNLGAGTVVTVTVDKDRVEELERHAGRGAAVRASSFDTSDGRTAPNAPSQTARMRLPEGPAGQPGVAYPPYQNGLYPQQPAFPQTYAPYQGYPQGYPAYQQPYMAQMPGDVRAQNPYAPVPGAMPPGITGAAGAPYPQGYPEYPAVPQYPLPHEPFPMSQGADGGGAGFVDERGRLALSFISEHGQAGPSELADAYGQSGPTWSRTLATLNKQGLVEKHGQKYHLTALGVSWTQTR